MRVRDREGDRAPVLRQMSGGKPQQRLTHEEVVERFVDYHFGRLTPAMNRAVEAHVRSCERCKREGLARAGSERQAANRKLRRVRGGKPLLGRRGRIVVLGLLVILVAQLALYELARGKAQPLLTAFTQWGAQGGAPGTGGAPDALRPYLRLPADASDASAISLSVNAKLLAVAQGGAHPNVRLWSTRSGDLVATLPWSGRDAPGAVAWSPDGSMVAASSPTTLVIWTVTPVAIVAAYSLPAQPTLTVFDLRQKAPLSTSDPAQAFARGPLVWGANGALQTAPAGAAGPAGVTTPQAPVIGLWSSEGTHLFGEGHGAVHLGVSLAEVQSGVALLHWSPDGRYLLWAQADLPVSGAGSSPASAPPDALAQGLVKRIAAASKAGAPGQNDAVLWFSPDATSVAVCDRTQPDARMTIYSVATGDATATINVPCASLPTHAAQWSSDGAMFYVAPLSGPVTIYKMP
jgi:hypothetical protein